MPQDRSPSSSPSANSLASASTSTLPRSSLISFLGGGVTVAVSLSLAAISILSLSACIPTLGFLKPDAQPRELIASSVIRTPSPILKGEGKSETAIAPAAEKNLIKILAVDGKANKLLENKAVVAPGVHTIDIAVEVKAPADRGKNQALVTKANTSLTFETKADREYLVETREDNNGLWVWVLDVTADEVVAGSKP